MIAVFALISIVGAASLDQHGHNVHPVPLVLEAKIGQIFHDMDMNDNFFIDVTEISTFFAAYDKQPDPNNPTQISIDLNEFKQSWDYGDTDAQKEHNFKQMDTNNDGALTEVDLTIIFLTADRNTDSQLDFGEFDTYMRSNIYNNVHP